MEKDKDGPEKQICFLIIFRMVFWIKLYLCTHEISRCPGFRNPA
jgi:hypothetical protein